MAFLQDLGPITPEGVAKALKRVAAILSIIATVLLFILDMVKSHQE